MAFRPGDFKPDRVREQRDTKMHKMHEVNAITGGHEPPVLHGVPASCKLVDTRLSQAARTAREENMTVVQSTTSLDVARVDLAAHARDHDPACPDSASEPDAWKHRDTSLCPR
jgi:hypothetical protein